MNDIESTTTRLLERLASHAPTTAPVPSAVRTRTHRWPVKLAVVTSAVGLTTLLVLAGREQEELKTVPASDQPASVADEPQSPAPAETSAPAHAPSSLGEILAGLGAPLPDATDLAILEQAPFCGVSNDPPFEGNVGTYDGDARPATCFLNAAITRTTALIVQTYRSDEMQSTRIYRSRPDGHFDWLTNDSGAGRWTRYDCAGIISQDVRNAAPPPSGDPSFYKVFSCGSSTAALQPVQTNDFLPDNLREPHRTADCGTAVFHEENSAMVGAKMSDAAVACINGRMGVSPTEFAYRLTDGTGARWSRSDGSGKYEIDEYLRADRSFTTYRCEKPAIDGEGAPVMGSLSGLNCTQSSGVCPAAARLADFIAGGLPTYEYEASRSPADLAARATLVRGRIVAATYRERRTETTNDSVLELRVAPRETSRPPGGEEIVITTPFYRAIGDPRGEDVVVPDDVAGVEVLAFVDPASSSVLAEGLYLACGDGETMVPALLTPSGADWAGLSTLDAIAAAATAN